MFTTAPFASASAGVKPWVSRSAPSTVSSIASRMCSKVVLASGFIDGTRNALLISTSTLPYASSDLLDQIVDLSLVGDVGADRHRAPAEVGDLLGHLVEPPTVRAASTRSAPASAQRRASVVPSAGPTPQMTTTLSSSSPAICYPSILSAICSGARDPRPPVLFGDLVRLVVRQRVPPPRRCRRPRRSGRRPR